MPYSQDTQLPEADRLYERTLSVQLDYAVRDVSTRPGFSQTINSVLGVELEW